jgi:hypothetical protein
MIPIGLVVAAAALAPVAAAPASPTAPTIPTGAVLTAEIKARDAEMFDLFFTGCDPERLRTMLSPDVEFYHDKAGFLYHDANEMVADYAKNCAARLKPLAYHSRRELIPASLHVDPVPGFGAIEDGEHQFYERRRDANGKDGPERRVGYGRFTMVWALGSDGEWRLSRILSFAHATAEE